MVWIHGGAFNVGSHTIGVYDPKILVSEEGVIVVSLQYRLASIGFISLATEDVPGNAGLLDQTMALSWIRSNIEAFGGDPAKITVFGESAGSMSVSLHLLSPLSRDLFSQGIMESGSVLGAGAVGTLEDAVSLGLTLAKLVGCPSSSQDALDTVIQCLRDIPAQTLVDKSQEVSGLVKPIVDGHFITKMPKEYFLAEDFKHTNILLGTNTGDGFLTLGFVLPDLICFDENLTISRNNFTVAVQQLHTDLTPITAKAIEFEYTSTVNPCDSAQNIDALGQMVTDYSFTCPTNVIAQQYAEAGNIVYQYVFAHHPSVSHFPSWTKAYHTDEIQFVFGAPLDPARNFTSLEQDLSQRMMRFWANFAKTGNTSEPEASVTWPCRTATGQEYVTLDTPAVALSSSGPRLQQCAFWAEYVVELNSETSNSSQCKCPGSSSSRMHGFKWLVLIVAVTSRLFRSE